VPETLYTIALTFHSFFTDCESDILFYICMPCCRVYPSRITNPTCSVAAVLMDRYHHHSSLYGSTFVATEPSSIRHIPTVYLVYAPRHEGVMMIIILSFDGGWVTVYREERHKFTMLEDMTVELVLNPTLHDQQCISRTWQHRTKFHCSNPLAWRN